MPIVADGPMNCFVDIGASLQRSEEDACGGMSSFVERMQSGSSGPSERLTLDLAALGGLITALQQLADRIGALEVKKERSKLYPYSSPRVGPGADPGVQAVSPQVTGSESRHRPGSRLPLLSARPAVTSVAFTRWRYL